MNGVGFLLALALLIPALSLAQIPDTLWTRTYGGNGTDNGASVRQTSDGGFIVAGSTTSFGAGGYDARLIKTDAQGDTIWTRTYGGNNDDVAASLRPTDDGGYIIAGTTSSFGEGGEDLWLIKTNSQGDTIWTRTYGGANIERGYSVQPSADGGYLIVGCTTSFGAGGYDAWLIKTDAQGDTLWTRTYGGSGFDYVAKGQPTTDGGYVIVGYTGSYGAGAYDIWLIKTDAAGDTVWTRTFGESIYEIGFSVQQTSDGGYVITGYRDFTGAGDCDVLLIKTNAAGDTVWTKIFGGSNWDKGRSVQQTSDGGYIITGYTESYGAGGRDVWLIRVAPEDIDGLVAYYPFSGSASDESGNGNDGTVNGATLAADRFGNANSAYSFDGVDDYVDTQANYDVSTLSFWMKTNSSNGFPVGQRLDANEEAGNYAVRIYENNIQVILYSGVNTSQFITGSTNVSDDGWHHVSVLSGPDGLKYYLDGILDAENLTLTAVLGAGGNDDTMMLGRVGGNDVWNYYQGILDDIRIYNRALSEAEIGALYYEGGWGVPPAIVSTSPAQNALNVAWEAAISVTFDMAMDGASLDDTTFVVHASQTGQLSGVYSYDPGDSTATFTPANPFKVGERVSVTLTTGVQSAAGDTLVSPFTWSFTTEVLGGSGEFADAVNYAAEERPNSVTAADLDGDGDIDLVTVSIWSSDVSVLLNNGSGSFATAVNYGVGSTPNSATAADLDGDGDVDLAVANVNSLNVSVLLNSGSGSYADAVNYGVGSSPRSVTAADLDGDGDSDLAVANQANFTVSVLLNIGDGSFATAVNYDVGSQPYSVTTADLDGDGDTDIAVANMTSNNVSVLLNIGLGSFAATVNYGVGSQPYSVATADLDGDEDADLAVANFNSNNVSVLLNNGDGSFAAAVHYSVGTQPYSVTTEDLDADGDSDLAVANQGSHNISALMNDGSGLFSAAVNYGVGSYPFSVTSADLDGDGDADLATANYGSDNISVLLNTGDLQGPVISNISTTSSPDIGDNITVTATVTDPQGLAAVDLHYARGGASAFTRTSMSFQGSDTELGAIPGSAVTEKGVAYFISAEDEAGNVSRSDTASIQVGFPSGTLTTGMTGSAFRTGFPKDQWRLISIPGDIDNASVSSIIRAGLGSAPSDETWKIFRYTGPGSDDYAAASSFASGEGYFLKQVVEESVHFTLGAGRSVDLAGWSLTLPARKWRFVASPYPFAVSVDADQGTFKGPYAYGAFGSGGQEGWSTAQVQTTFQPWGGYIIYNNTDQTQTLEIKPAVMGKALLAKGTVELTAGWLLHLTAEGEHYFDAGNVIGRIQGAAEGLDDYDHPEPPYAEGYISLIAENPDWEGGLPRTSDIRSSEEINGVWDLLLHTRGETAPVSLSFEWEGDPPAAIALLDILTRDVRDLRNDPRPVIVSDYDERFPRRLKVMAGTPGFVQSAIDEALAQLPEEFALSQNYPNPFNPSTTIEYALPQPARVSLRVYNLLGREIVVLVDDWQDLGYHEIIWHGRDRAGRSVASGVYFTVLQADGHVLMRKMVLLK